jgi:hypothetical protein
VAKIKTIFTEYTQKFPSFVGNMKNSADNLALFFCVFYCIQNGNMILYDSIGIYGDRGSVPI